MGTVMKAANGESYRTSAKRLVQPLWQKASLRGLFIFETNVAMLARNWAENGNDAKLVGAPAMGAGGNGAYFQQATDYLQTDIPETSDLTYIFTIDQATAAAFWPLGNYNGARSASDATLSNGCLMQMTVIGSDQRYNAIFSRFSGSAGDATSNVTASKLVAPGGNRMIAVRIDEPAGTMHLSDLTGGGADLVVTRPGGTVRDLNPLPFRIGSNYLSRDTTPAMRMYDCCILSEFISDDELAAYATWLRQYWARRGITV